MTPEKLEAAWRTFLEGDVDVAQYLAPDVDDKELAALRARLAGADPAGRELATEELVGLLRHCRNVVVLDAVLAPALDAYQRHEEALAARVRALRRAPRWHPIVTPRLLGNIGYELLALGRVDEARTWYERALAWDPTDPFACAGLAEALLAVDEIYDALAYRNHLAAAGYPAEHSRDFDAAYDRLGLRTPDVEPYAPELDAVPALDDAGFARFVTALDRETHLAPKERLRGHALACWRHGAHAAALVWARAAVRVPWWGDRERGRVETMWAAVVEAEIASRLDVVGELDVPDDPHEPEAIAERVEAAERGHRLALHDPSGRVRWVAAQALDGDPLAVALLDEAARHP